MAENSHDADMLSAKPYRQLLWLLASVAAINVLAGILLVSIGESPAALTLRRALVVSTALSSALILLGGGLVVWASRGALAQISKGIQQLRTGGYPRLMVPDANPLGFYVRQLNELAEEFRQRDEKTRLWADERQREFDKASRLLRAMHSAPPISSTDLHGLLLVDAEDRVLGVNRAAANLLGRSAAEIANQPFTAIAEDLREIAADADEVDNQCALLAVGDVHEIRFGPELMAGASLTITRIPLIGAAAEGRAGSGETDAERMKAEFISTVSHELRTPLTAIKGSLSLIRGGGSGHIAAETRNLVDIALSNTDRLIATVSNMLEVAQLESGGIRFDLGPVPLERVVQQAVQEVTAAAKARKIEIEPAIPEPTPILEADGKRIGEVLGQLLANAVKFSGEGAKVKLAAQSDGQMVTVAVSDQGVGMTAEFLARLFQKFEHEQGILRRDTQGCGLGLAIARLIVEGHGGRIWAESAPGAGSTFFFTVPVAKLAKLPAVLVADSDDDLRPELEQWCSSRGYRLLTCHNPAEVVKLAQRWHPRLLILDLNVGDPREISSTLAGEAGTSSIPVVCFESRNGSRTSGASNLHFVGKPLRATDLDGVMEMSAQARGGGAACD